MMTRLYRFSCWKRLENHSEALDIFKSLEAQGWTVDQVDESDRESIWSRCLGLLLRIGITRYVVLLTQKLPWLFSDHDLQTGFMWFPVLRQELQTKGGDKIFWRFRDSDLVLFRDSIDEAILKRTQERERLGFPIGRL